MKYILSIIIAICIYTPALSASISISTDKSSYNIDETITLLINVESENTSNGEIQMQGVEDNFHIIGKSQSQQTQIINGASSSKLYFNISLLANTAGDFTLGPVILNYQDGEAVSSETIQLEVTGERIMVNPNLPTNNNSSGTTAEQDLSKIQLGNNNSTEDNETIGVYGEVMEDIYDIKPKLLPKLYHPLTGVIALIGTLLIWFILNIKNLLSSPPARGELGSKKKNINYSKMLKSIQARHFDDSKEVFYGKIGGLFREYLDDRVEYGLSGKSLIEAKKILPKGLHVIYTSIYYPAYDNKKDSANSRSKIIEKLEKIFSKK